MSDRGRGRGPSRPEFGSRPLGRVQEFGTGRGGLNRGPGPGNRPLGSVPVRTSSGGLSSLAPGGLGAAMAAGGGAAGAISSSAAGGRGAGPDHREVRYADGVLAMINVLRLLTLGGPRTWDATLHKQLGMQIAPRPTPGLAGREVNLMVNHFTLSIRPGSNMAVYAVHVTCCRQQQQESNSKQAANANENGERLQHQQCLPRRLVQHVLQQLASDAGWPAGWVLVSSSRLAASSSFLPTNSVTDATVTLQQEQRQEGQDAEAPDAALAPAAYTGTFQVRFSYLGTQDINAVRSTAVADAAGSSTPLLDGISLLEALLTAAALQAPTKPPATAPVPVPGAGAANATAVSIGSLGSAGTGLMGLAAAAGTPGAQPGQLGLTGAALGGPNSVGSPGAGLLSATLAQAATSGAAAPTASSGAAANSSTGVGGSSSTSLIASTIASAARVQIGDAVFLYAPGNPDVHAPLGGGLEGWLGYTQKVLQTQSGTSLVVDLTAAPFFEPGPLLRLLPALLGRPAALAQEGQPAAEEGSSPAAGLAALNSVEHRRLQQQLKGVKVEVSLPGQAAKLFSVSAVSASSASSTRITLHSSSAAGDAGSEVSVQQYIKAVYGTELTAPQLPCVDVAHSSSRQPIWYPLELCRLPPGQRFRPPLEQHQLAALARLSAKKSTDRRVWLEALIAPLPAASPAPSNNGSLPVPVPGAAPEPAAAAVAASSTAGSSISPLSGSGVEVSSLLGIARGRVLPAPHLAYQQPECCYPGSQGQWNVKHCRLPGVSKISSWVLVVLLPQAQVDLEGPSGVVPFMQDLTQSLNGMGIECTMPPIVYEQPGMSVLQHLRAGCEAAQKHFNTSAELLLVLLPSRSSQLYAEVKLASDAALGLPSQVMVAPVAGVGKGAAPRGRLQYCANLGLKINAKMGGVNMRLAGNPDQVIPVVGGRPFILFGVALAAPTVSASPGTPAAAAVVASRDRSLGRYSSRVLLQPWEPQQQQHLQANSLDVQQHQSPYIVQGLKGAAKELLIDFYRQNGGRKPEALLCYRAVSSEGQGQELVAAEYEALRAACFELEESYCPPVTFITVSRSHTTRLFPADRDNQDKSGNCVPGTVVDTGICHPTQFDFFLNSHAGLQGHNKPAHYHVLVDENGFTADGLQLLTYWLCYLYCRCTRSVSMVPPAYYAQLAAARGRLIATGRELLDMSSGAGSDATEAEGMAAGVDFDVRVNAKLGGSMYYV